LTRVRIGILPNGKQAADESAVPPPGSDGDEVWRGQALISD